MEPRHSDLPSHRPDAYRAAYRIRRAGPPLNGVHYAYVMAGDPLFAASPTSPLLKVAVNAQGEGRLQLQLGSIPPGQSFLLQAVDLNSYEVSEPVVIDLVKQ